MQGRDVYLKFYETAITNYPVPYFPNTTINWDNSPPRPPRRQVGQARRARRQPGHGRQFARRVPRGLPDHQGPPAGRPDHAQDHHRQRLERMARRQRAEPEKEYGYGYLEAIKAVFGSGQ